MCPSIYVINLCKKKKKVLSNCQSFVKLPIFAQIFAYLLSITRLFLSRYSLLFAILYHLSKLF